jgi:hypothetical protein
MNRTTQVPADGVAQETLGTFQYLRVRSATGAAEISFDGNAWQTALPNDQFGPLDLPKRVYFRAPAGIACAVTFTYSKDPIAAQDTAQSTASTIAQGNLNIANSTDATATLPKCDADGFLWITDGMNLKVPGNNAQGNRRQIIILSTSANGATLMVGVSPTVTFMSIAPGTVFPFVSGDDFYLSGHGATAKVAIGEFFLKNNG